METAKEDFTWALLRAVMARLPEEMNRPQIKMVGAHIIIAPIGNPAPYKKPHSNHNLNNAKSYCASGRIIDHLDYNLLVA